MFVVIQATLSATSTAAARRFVRIAQSAVLKHFQNRQVFAQDFRDQFPDPGVGKGSEMRPEGGSLDTGRLQLDATR